MRTYKLFGQTETGLFTDQKVMYNEGSHPWIVWVRAESLEEAIACAEQNDCTNTSPTRIFCIWRKLDRFPRFGKPNWR